MPTYEYRCDHCEHACEAFQSMTAKPLRKCPACGRLKLKRLIGVGAGVIFKGSGFYETDYRSDSYRKAAEAEKKTGDTKADANAKPDGKKTDNADSAKTPGKAEGASAKTTRKSKDD